MQPSEIRGIFRLVLLILAASFCFSACAAAASNNGLSVSVSTSSLDFGAQLLNTTAQKTITTTNTGTRPLTVTNIALSGSTAFSLSGWTGRQSLSPGQSLSVTVKFAPSTAATYSATVSISYLRQATRSVAVKGTGVAPVAPVTVAVSPASTSVETGKAQQFLASVSGTTNTAVTWSVSGVQGGNSTVGTISSTGLYTAPQAVPSTATVTITARSAADSAVASSATATITAPAAAPTTTYDRYVSTTGSDSNDGMYGRPWRTIAKAASMAKPGYLIHVAPGTYTSGRITTSASGTSTARIRYISDSKWGAKLAGTESGQWGMVWYNTGSYVDIVGFDVTGAGAWGLVSAGSYVRYMNNHAHDLKPGSCWGTGGAGIAHSNYSATGNETVSNVIHNVGDPAVQCSTVHGMYQMNGYGKIVNNLIFNNWGWGIHTYHATTNLTISNNTLFGNTYGGIVISASSGDFPGGSGRHDNSLISNNIVYNNGKVSGASGYGIEEYGSTSSIGPNNRYLNNLVYNNGPANWRLMVTGGSGSGTVTATPGFVNFTATMSGDYHVSSTSLAVHAGTYQGAPSNDIDGGARPTNATIGAYEYNVSTGAYPWQ